MIFAPKMMIQLESWNFFNIHGKCFRTISMAGLLCSLSAGRQALQS